MSSNKMEAINEAISKNSFQANEDLIEAEVSSIMSNIEGTCKNADEYYGKIRGYKSALTRALNAAAKTCFELKMDEENKDANYRSLLLNARISCERPYRIICRLVDLINETGDVEYIKKAVTESEKIDEDQRKFNLRFDPIIIALCKRIDTAERREFLSMVKLEAKNLAEDKDADKALSIAKDCRPNFILDIKSSPYDFETWTTLYSNFLLATGADRKSPKIQQSVALPLLSVDLFERIKKKVTDTTSAIAYVNGTIRLDLDNENPTILELLAQEWEDEYPIAIRRKLVHELRQDATSSAADWVRNMEKQFRIAHYRKMTDDQREVSVTTVSLRNENLRTLIIEEIKKNKIHNMDELLSFVKLKESSCKESKDSNQNSTTEVYVTQYQKQKKGQILGSQNGGSHRQPTSQGTYNNRGRRGKGKWCEIHKKNSHWTSECFLRGKSRGESNDRRADRRADRRGTSPGWRTRGRSPTPGYRNSSRSPSKVHSSMLLLHHVYKTEHGISIEENKPILNFNVKNAADYFKVPCYADTGSSKSIFSLQTSRLLGLSMIEAKNESLIAANQQDITVNGKATLEISFGNGKFLPMDVLISEDFDVQNGYPINIVCLPMLEKLHILHISHLITTNRKITMISEKDCNFSYATQLKVETMQTKSDITEPEQSCTAESAKLEVQGCRSYEEMSYSELKDLLLDLYKDVIKDELSEEPMRCEPYKLKLNPEKVKKFPPSPVTHVPPYPLHMEKECVDTLKDLLKENCIAELTENETTPYLCSSLFVLKKSGKLRLVTNHDSLNCNIDRLNYPIQSPQSLLQRIPSTAKHYFIADLYKSYYQNILHKDSQILCSFLTPTSRYKWIRSPMGLAISGDIFNLRTSQAFLNKNLDILKCIDDCALYGSSRSELMKKAMKFLDICRSWNIIVSKSKLQLDSKCEYLGNILDGPTIAMAPSKIKAILTFPLPIRSKDIRSWCGLANVFSRHVPDLAIILRPMQKQLQKGYKVVPTPEFKQAFEASKKIISSAPILSAFKPGIKTILTTDSSKDCFGYALLQLHQNKYYLVKCGSKAMNKHQINYSMSDKELESLRYGLMDCSYYLRGLKHFVCYNDHKSLEQILKKPLDKIVSSRQLRCIIDIRLYTFTFEYKPGTSKMMILADLLSRHPLYDHFSGESSEANSSIESFRSRNISLLTFYGATDCKDGSGTLVLMTSDTITKSLLQQLAEETQKDTACQILKDGILSHTKWENLLDKDMVHKYKPIYGELTLDKSGLLLVSGDRILCPRSMVFEICNRLHIGHPGRSRSLALAKQFFWAPNLRESVIRTCISCNACQTFMRSNPKQPISTEFPDESEVFPMSHLSSDVLEVDRHKYIVNRDRYSGYLWANKVNDITSNTIIKVFEEISMNFGFPTLIQTDNATAYTSKLINDWALNHDIKLIHSSPYNSNSCGLVESGNRIVRGLLNKSKDFAEFKINLFGHNNCPRTDSNNYSPAELLLNRKLKGFLPCLPSKLIGNTDQKLYSDRIMYRQKEYSKLQGTYLPDFTIGDKVRVQNTITNLWDRMGTIQRVESEHNNPSKSYIVKLEDGTSMRRNKKRLRMLHPADLEANFSEHSNIPISKEQYSKVPPQSPPQQTVPILKKAPMLVKDGENIFFGKAVSESAKSNLRRSARLGGKRVCFKAGRPSIISGPAL